MVVQLPYECAIPISIPLTILLVNSAPPYGCKQRQQLPEALVHWTTRRLFTKSKIPYMGERILGTWSKEDLDYRDPQEASQGKCLLKSTGAKTNFMRI